MAMISDVPHPRFWRTFWTNAVMAPRTSLGFMRVDFVLGTVLVIPLTQMVFFAFVVTLGGGGSAAIAFTAIGNAVATVTYSSVFSVCQTTDSEKQQGTMEHLLVSPAGRLALYFGRGLIPILVSLATVAVGLTYAVAFFGVVIPASAVPDSRRLRGPHRVRDGGVRTLARGPRPVPPDLDHPRKHLPLHWPAAVWCQLPPLEPPSVAAAGRRRAPPDLGALGDPGRDFWRGPRTSRHPLGGRRPVGDRLPRPGHGVLGGTSSDGPWPPGASPVSEGWPRGGSAGDGTPSRGRCALAGREYSADVPLCPEGAIFGRSP